jgi:hypothetical protein
MQGSAGGRARASTRRARVATGACSGVRRATRREATASARRDGRRCERWPRSRRPRASRRSRAEGCGPPPPGRRARRDRDDAPRGCSARARGVLLDPSRRRRSVNARSAPGPAGVGARWPYPGGRAPRRVGRPRDERAGGEWRSRAGQRRVNTPGPLLGGPTLSLLVPSRAVASVSEPDRRYSLHCIDSMQVRSKPLPRRRRNSSCSQWQAAWRFAHEATACSCYLNGVEPERFPEEEREVGDAVHLFTDGFEPNIAVETLQMWAHAANGPGASSSPRPDRRRCLD